MNIKNLEKIATGEKYAGEKNSLNRAKQGKIRDTMYEILQEALDEKGIYTVKIDKCGLILRADDCDVEIKAIVKQSRYDIAGRVYEMEMAEKERKAKEKAKEKKIAKDRKLRKALANKEKKGE